jgi:hypothetical protein
MYTCYLSNGTFITKSIITAFNITVIYVIPVCSCVFSTSVVNSNTSAESYFPPTNIYYLYVLYKDNLNLPSHWSSLEGCQLTAAMQTRTADIVYPQRLKIKCVVSRTVFLNMHCTTDLTVNAYASVSVTYACPSAAGWVMYTAYTR